MEFADASDHQRKPAGANTNYEMVSIAMEQLLEKSKTLGQALQQWNDPLGLCEAIPGYRSGDVELIPSSDDVIKVIVFPIDVSAQGPDLSAPSLQPHVVSLVHVDNFQAHDVVEGLDGATRMRYTLRAVDPTALNGFRGCASATRLASTLWTSACDVADQLSQLRRVLAGDPEFRLSFADSAKVIQTVRPFVSLLPFLQDELIDAALADSEAVVDLLSEIQDNAGLLLNDSAHLKGFIACSETARRRCQQLNPQRDADDLRVQLGYEAGKTFAQTSLDNSFKNIVFRALDAQMGSAVESVAALYDEVAEWDDPLGLTAVFDGCGEFAVTHWSDTAADETRWYLTAAPVDRPQLEKLLLIGRDVWVSDFGRLLLPTPGEPPIRYSTRSVDPRWYWTRTDSALSVQESAGQATTPSLNVVRRQCEQNSFDQLAALYDSVGQQLEDLLDSFEKARVELADPELNACLVWISRKSRGVSQSDAMRHAVENLARFSLRLEVVGQRYQDVVTASRFGPVGDRDAQELAGIADVTYRDLIARTRAVIGFEAD